MIRLTFFRRDSRDLLFVDRGENVSLADLTQSRPLESVTVLARQERAVGSATINGDGRWIAVARAGGMIDL